MISEEEIVRQLKEKETLLLEQLTKVRMAIEAFGGKEYKPEIHGVSNNSPAQAVVKDALYDKFATFNEKIIAALGEMKRAAYVVEIVDFLENHGEEMEHESLMRRITHNASKMYREGILEADKRRRQYRYSLSPKHFDIIEGKDIKANSLF